MKISFFVPVHSEVYKRNLAGAIWFCAAPGDTHIIVVLHRVYVLCGWNDRVSV